MLNYLKSELYRVVHSKEVYILTASMAGLTVLFNLVLFLFNRVSPNFPYAKLLFSMNMLTGSLQDMFMAAGIMVSFLFTDEFRNGTLKNVISFGISRTTFFLGKCIVCTLTAGVSMIVILFFYVGSALLLLENAGLEPLWEMLGGVMSNIPAAAASLILTVGLYCNFHKDMAVILWWMMIMWILPTVSFFVGLKIDIIGRIAEWMPWNYLNYEVKVGMRIPYQCQCLWDTPEGLAKCLIAGTAGILIFTVFGIICFRKKEIQ